jgi:hypothetical protein
MALSDDRIEEILLDLHGELPVMRQALADLAERQKAMNGKVAAHETAIAEAVVRRGYCQERLGRIEGTQKSQGEALASTVWAKRGGVGGGLAALGIALLEILRALKVV